MSLSRNKASLFVSQLLVDIVAFWVSTHVCAEPVHASMAIREARKKPYLCISYAQKSSTLIPEATLIPERQNAHVLLSMVYP